MARYWLSDGSLRVGFPDSENDAVTVSAEQANGFVSWLQLCDGSRSQQQLLESAQAMGWNRADASRLFDSLVTIHAIVAIDPRPHPRFIETSQRALSQPSQSRGLNALQLAQRRQSARVVVDGIGIVPAQIFRGLDQAHLTAGWSTHSSTRIQPHDVSVNGISADFIGEPWRRLDQRISRATLVIACADFHELHALSERFSGTLVLPVTHRSDRLAVGPLLNQLDWSPAKPHHEAAYIAVQLEHGRRTTPVLAQYWIDAFVGSVLGWVLEIVETPTHSALSHTSWELLPPSPQWRCRTYH